MQEFLDQMALFEAVGFESLFQQWQPQRRDDDDLPPTAGGVREPRSPLPGGSPTLVGV